MKTRISKSSSVLFFSVVTLFTLVTFSSLSAHSATDVTCWDGSCHSRGWTSRDLQTGQEIESGCYRDGCKTSGWIIGSSPKSYTQCKSQGCFQEGWYQLDSQTQTLQKQVVCRSQSDQPVNPTNCYQYGWVTYTPAGQESLTTCYQNDCAKKGWLVKTPSQQTKHVTCKSGGCFVNGWRETDY